MQATEIDRPELSLVAWGRTAHPVVLPSFLRARASSSVASRPSDAPVDDALFGFSAFALLAAPVAVVIAALRG